MYVRINGFYFIYFLFQQRRLSNCLETFETFLNCIKKDNKIRFGYLLNN